MSPQQCLGVSSQGADVRQLLTTESVTRRRPPVAETTWTAGVCRVDAGALGISRRPDVCLCTDPTRRIFFNAASTACHHAERTSMNQPETLLRVSEVCSRIGVSRATVYKFVAAGRIKPPVKISLRASRFPESEISEFIADRIREGRRAA